MNVAILDDHPNLSRCLLRKVWTAARTCYSADTPSVLWEKSAKLSDEKMLAVVQGQVIESGHWSCLRHASVSYAIEGISRACAQQLTRHHAGYDWEMQSQRYAKPDPDAVVVPPSVAGDQERGELYAGSVEDDHYFFDRLVETGVPQEDARYVLPLGSKTNLVGTINLNALINLCGERLCTLAQTEIRELVNRMRVETVKVVPWMKPHLIIKCMRSNICFEARNADGHCSIRRHVSQVDIVPKASAK